jgi:hypothetical protein
MWGCALERGWRRGGDATHDGDDPKQRERLRHDTVGAELEKAGVAVRLEGEAVVRVEECFLEDHCGQAEQDERDSDESPVLHSG